MLSERLMAVCFSVFVISLLLTAQNTILLANVLTELHSSGNSIRKAQNVEHKKMQNLATALRNVIGINYLCI